MDAASKNADTLGRYALESRPPTVDEWAVMNGGSVDLNVRSGKGATMETDRSDTPELTREQGIELFDRNARQLLGISGVEFLRGWDNGDYQQAEDPRVSSVAVLIPFAR